MIVAVSLFMFLTTCEYTKRVNAAGVIVPRDGAIRIHAPAHASVSRVHIAEGQHVKRGDVLFTISDERRSPDGNSSQTYHAIQKESLGTRRLSIEAASQVRLTVDATEAAAISKKLQLNRLDREENSKQTKVESGRLRLAKEALDRQLGLATRGYVSKAEVASAREGVAARKAQILVLRRDAIALERTRADLMAEDRKRGLALRTDLASHARDLAALGQDEAVVDAAGQFAVVAAEDGIVTAITARPGSIATDLPLAQLVPDSSELIAHVYAGSESIGFAEAGQTVRLRVKAFPYQHFGQLEGNVIDVSEAPVRPDDMSSPLDASSLSFYRLRVRLRSVSVKSVKGARRLRPGMAVDTSIELESRALIHWIMEPLYGARLRTL